MVVLRYFAGFMVWITIFAVNFFLVGITIYCFSLAGMLGDNPVSEVSCWQSSSSWCVCVCVCMCVCMCVCLEDNLVSEVGCRQSSFS